MNIKIGIIGQGFVGTAVREGFIKHYNIQTYDKYDDTKSTCASLEQLVSASNVINCRRLCSSNRFYRPGQHHCYKIYSAAGHFRAFK